MAGAQAAIVDHELEVLHQGWKALIQMLHAPLSYPDSLQLPTSRFLLCERGTNFIVSVVVLGSLLLTDEPHLHTYVKCIVHQKTLHFKLMTETEFYISVCRCIVWLHFPLLTTSKIIHRTTL